MKPSPFGLSFYWSAPGRRSLRLAALLLGLSLGGLPLLTFPSANAAETTPVPAPLLIPRIHVVDTTVDFGEIPSGERRKHTFLVNNTGNATLDIRDVRTSCGCTTAGQWDRSIPPGGTGLIPIQFDTQSFTGPIQRTITVTSNDPEKPNLTLHLKAQIWTPIDISPRSVAFQYDADTTLAETRVVRIVNRRPEPLEFEPPMVDNPAFTATLEVVQPGREFAVHISTVPPIGKGFVLAPVVLRPKDPAIPEIRITTHAVERVAVTVSPAQLTLPAGPPRSAQRPFITVRNNATTPLVLSNASINLPGASVEIKELQPGRLFTLSPVLPEDYSPTPGRTLELTVHSSHPRHALLRVPIIAASTTTTVTPTPATAVSPRPVLTPVRRTNAVLQRVVPPANPTAVPSQPGLTPPLPPPRP